MNQMKLSSIPCEDVVSIVKKLRNREYIEMFQTCKEIKNIAEKRDYRPVLKNEAEKTLAIHFYSPRFNSKIKVISGIVINVDVDDNWRNQHAVVFSTLNPLKGEIFPSIRICSTVDTTSFELFCSKVANLLKELNITSKHLKWDIEDRPELMSQVLSSLKCASLSAGALKDATFLQGNDKLVGICPNYETVVRSNSFLEVQTREIQFDESIGRRSFSLSKSIVAVYENDHVDSQFRQVSRIPCRPRNAETGS